MQMQEKMKLKTLIAELKKYDEKHPGVNVRFTVAGYVIVPVGDWDMEYVQTVFEEESVKISLTEPLHGQKMREELGSLPLSD